MVGISIGSAKKLNCYFQRYKLQLVPNIGGAKGKFFCHLAIENNQKQLYTIARRHKKIFVYSLLSLKKKKVLSLSLSLSLSRVGSWWWVSVGLWVGHGFVVGFWVCGWVARFVVWVGFAGFVGGLVVVVWQNQWMWFARIIVLGCWNC